MATYKSIVTLTWKFDTELDEQRTLEFVKCQLEEILDTSPHGEGFDGFAVQVELARMKDRKKLVHLDEFDPDDVFPYVTEHDSKHEFEAHGVTYSVRMNSDRYLVFRANRVCVACGLVGTRMLLDLNPGDGSPHFNLYGEENGRLVLMTKDHILAKSKGGLDELGNFVTCCSICNNLKADYDLTYEQVRELRTIQVNEQKLKRKEVRDLINRRRDQMAGKIPPEGEP